MAEETQNTGAEDKAKNIFRAEKIYIKDVSFESPNSPAIFTDSWKPQLSIELASTASRLNEDLYDIVAQVTVTAKLNETTAYLAEVHQAGIFTIRGFTPEQLEEMQHIHCLRILYPYACSNLSELVSKGGFPQLLLAPVDFRTLFQQRKQAEHQQASGSTG